MAENNGDVLEKAYAAVLDKQFAEALELLSDYRKMNLEIGKTKLLMLLCGYQASSTEEMLTSVSSSMVKLQKLAERSDWNEMLVVLPSGQREYVKDVIEYCALTIVQTGEGKKIMQKSQQPPKNVTSSFARMDEEELHTMQRVQKLERSRGLQKPLSHEDLYYDYESRFPSDSVHTYTPKDTGNNGLNIALDILDLLLLDDDLRTPAFSRSRDAALNRRMDGASLPQYSMPKQGKKTFTQNVFMTAMERLEKSGASKEEMQARRAQLLKKISVLEKEILSFSS